MGLDIFIPLIVHIITHTLDLYVQIKVYATQITLEGLII